MLFKVIFLVIPEIHFVQSYYLVTGNRIAFGSHYKLIMVILKILRYVHEFLKFLNFLMFLNFIKFLSILKLFNFLKFFEFFKVSGSTVYLVKNKSELNIIFLILTKSRCIL